MSNPARRARKLSAAVASAAALAIPVCSCSSSASVPTPAHAAGTTSLPASASARATGQAAGPSGQVAGGTAQGVTVGVPAGWKFTDFSRDSMAEAYTKLGLPGITQARFNSSFKGLAGAHAIFAVDTRHVTVLGGDQGDVLPNENAYCVSSGSTVSGASALAVLRQAVSSTVRQDLGTVTKQQDVTLGGVPAVETFYSPISPAPGINEQAVGIAAAPRAGTACYVYLTYPAAKIPATLLRETTGEITYP